MPGGRDEMQPEALAIVDGAGQATDLELAPVAGARIDLPDAKRSAKESPDARLHLPGDLDDARVVRSQRLGDETGSQDLGEERHVSAAGARA